MYDLASLLGIPLPYAVGIMEMLWHYASVNTPRGDIGSQPDEAIKQACAFSRKAPVLVKALADAGWIDADPEHRYILHDWPDHCEGAVVQLLRYRKHDFLPIYGKSINNRAKILPDSCGSREAKAKATAVGFDSGGSAEGGEMRTEWDDQWQDFRGKYEAAKPDLIEEDFVKAHHVWRVLDFAQREDSILGIAARIDAGQWQDPQYIPKPEKYLREDRKRKVVPRSGPISRNVAAQHRRFSQAEKEAEAFEGEYSAWEKRNPGKTRQEFADWCIEQAGVTA